MLQEFTKLVSEGNDLNEDQVCSAITALMYENIEPEVKADFLIALADKGESTEEIAAFARELRERATEVILDVETRKGEIVDVCGTGGDKLDTFNISTTVAILVAAAGVKVAKHGNRAITSKSGSSDVLGALGIPTDLSPADAATSIKDKGFAFLFAPVYHPAFKNIVPARKVCAERGQRTIFNFLGPMLNPARPSAQLVGVPNPALCEPLAKVLQSLGIRRGMVVSGAIEGDERHMDEISTLGTTTVAEFYQDKGFSVSKLSPTDLGIDDAQLSDLEGGDAEANAVTTRGILCGEIGGAKADAVLVNAGAALFVAGAADSIGAGIELAKGVIAGGKASAKLSELGG
ncbi:MAG: anthranilate phosphoribosyltransferase [Verrucomicrobiales bacterium]|nr:anthranilate phosphoribosyltransferase [Verrucomicrobiales bacterium]